jgi:signal transduction histidine kinase/CheY-like chemotaxis protein
MSAETGQTMKLGDMNTGLEDPGLQQRVSAAQAALGMERSRLSNLLSAPFGLLVVWLLWPVTSQAALLAWLVLKCAVVAGRAQVIRRWDAGSGDGHTLTCARRFQLWLAADGLVFGALATVLLPRNDAVYAATMIATVIAIGAVGLVVLAQSFAAMAALVLPMLLPAMVWQLTRGDALSLYMGGGIAIFLLLVIFEGRRAAAFTTEMLTLRFRFADLAAQREQALELAKRNSAVKDRFLATMSHEMRTPLHGILGLARLARREAPPDSELDERLAMVARTGEHLQSLIDDTLDLARSQAGQLGLRVRTLDLGSLLRSVVDMTHAQAAEKGLFLRLQMRSGAPATARGDERRLRQILINLLGNAIKFTESGGVTLRCGIEDGRLRIEVEDTGPGVPASQAEAVFDAFHQLDDGYGRRHGGAGLGLAISRELTRAMDGDLVCVSRTSPGALFRLTLPLAATTDPVEPAAPKAQHLPDAPGVRAMLTGSVLVVEDNPVNMVVAQASLEHLGLKVHRAVDGPEGVAAAQRLRPDLILMDCHMPGMDGFEATRRVRAWEEQAHSSRTPIVALTANAMQGDRELSLKAGMDDHLAKPFRDEDLRAMLVRWLPASRRDDAAAVPAAGPSPAG